MMDAGRHPRIEILRCSELLALEGHAGDFRVTIRRHPTGVDEQRCTACGACSAVCKFETPNPFDAGMGLRKAIGRPFPQSVPAAYAIDFEACKRCKQCVKACPRDAIDLDQQPVDETRAVGAVVVATGFDEFDPGQMRNYGYGVYPNVVTSLQFERLLSASGPTLGHVRRPSDQVAPQRLAYVQCVGARGEADRFHCSRFCCMNAVKNAILAKQHDPGVEQVSILYTDIRAFGKGSDDLYERARALDWIRFLRGRPSKIEEDPESHDLTLFVEDTETGRAERLAADMVVLSCAGTASHDTDVLAERLGLPTSGTGFLTPQPGASPVRSAREGVFLAGSAGGPQIIPDCVAQGSAAAMQVASLLGDAHRMPDESDAAPDSAAEALAAEPAARAEASSPPAGSAPGDSTRRSTAAGPSRVGVFLCHCGVNIAGVLDMRALLEEVRHLAGVAYATEELFACSSSSQESIQEAIRAHRLDRVVVAACTPRTHEPVFRENCAAAGLNPYLVEMVNIRDQCSWVHTDEPAEATRKAADLVRMAIARARLLEPLERVAVGVTPRVLVVGGGLPGMQAAIDLRRTGLEVVLIERAARLGGLVGYLQALYPDERDAGEAIQRLASQLRESGAEVRLETDLRGVEGYVGNFRVRLAPPVSATSAEADASRSAPPSGGEDPAEAAPGEEIEVGAIVLAPGGSAYAPQKGEFGFGMFENVIASLELERRLRDPARHLAGVRSVAFIQCVGSRRISGAHRELPGYPGCSRICCPATIKQTQQLGAAGIDSVVFYRDMRTVSLGAEEAYRAARRAGTLFLRFHQDHPPEIEGADGRAQRVTVRDSLLQRGIVAPVDLVVLATGLMPREAEARRIQEMLKTPRGGDGFFLERHPELSPVETCVDGVVLCGVAQGPKDLPDAFAQASAAAAKVAALLGRETLLLEPTVCEVAAERCRACGLCVSICEFHAPELVEDDRGGRVAAVNAALCKGCGTCAVWCPTGAIRARHFTDRQITAMIDTLFVTGAKR
ncbi:MAG: 4Fe-4S dicluster domain-containing protein [Candidatus Eisenbacteria bacterium]|nr:4Fe-4S dicluster domain-containing protein [Candidatus Eisenbacteria bacterium]